MEYWQNDNVSFCARRVLTAKVLLLVGLLGLVTSCSSKSDSACSSRVSISDYVASFSQGLDNFSEDRYAQLRSESNAAYIVVLDFFSIRFEMQIMHTHTGHAHARAHARAQRKEAHVSFKE
jgi:hypothetical protein